ncbi:MAG: hypothetical protein GY804_15425, partial [Alphaproteobacteria bacterium]|nr:hypothetical protein [Alphaproteobacteria bacterium]
VYGGYCKQGNKHYIVSHCNVFGVETKSIGQYIGLNDKNKNEIYQGDIVKDKHGDIYEVIWDEVNYGFDFQDAWTNRRHFHVTMEIVGNRFENPELMKDDESTVLRNQRA